MNLKSTSLDWHFRAFGNFWKHLYDMVITIFFHHLLETWWAKNIIVLREMRFNNTFLFHENPTWQGISVLNNGSCRASSISVFYNGSKRWGLLDPSYLELPSIVDSLHPPNNVFSLPLLTRNHKVSPCFKRQQAPSGNGGKSHENGPISLKTNWYLPSWEGIGPNLILVLPNLGVHHL